MPRHWITMVVFDHKNTEHITRATPGEVESVLMGTITAKKNRRSGSATWMATGRTRGGRELTVVYDYDETDGSARPITAF